MSPPRVRIGHRRVGLRWRGRPSSGDAEELGDFEGAVLATVYQRDQVRVLATVGLGLFTTQPRPLALATFMPSTVRSRITSDSNSATIASTLNNSRPTASVGS